MTGPASCERSRNDPPLPTSRGEARLLSAASPAPHAHEVRRLKKLWKRLHDLQRQSLSRDALLIKLGAAKKEAGRAWYLVRIEVPESNGALAHNGFAFTLRRDKLRAAYRREGRYLLRSNMTSGDPAQLWSHYMRLTEIEQAFKELKHDLAIRPIFHQHDHRIEAHIFLAFIAWCLQVTLKSLIRPHAPGLTPRAILDTFSTIQMVDVHVPTTDGRHLVLPRYTHPTGTSLAAASRHDVAATADTAHRHLSDATAPIAGADLRDLVNNLGLPNLSGSVGSPPWAASSKNWTGPDARSRPAASRSPPLPTGSTAASATCPPPSTAGIVAGDGP